MSRAARFLALAAIAASGACDVSSEVGSRWVASAEITAANGGVLRIDDAENKSLAGAELDLPPRTLAQTAMIGVSPAVALAGGDWIAAGPALAWDPADAALFGDAVFAIPAQLPAGRSAGDLLALSAAGPQPIFGSFDSDRGLFHFQANHLGAFQAVLGKPCTARDGCAQGNSCAHGYCRPGSGPNH